MWLSLLSDLEALQWWWLNHLQQNDSQHKYLKTQLNWVSKLQRGSKWMATIDMSVTVGSNCNYVCVHRRTHSTTCKSQLRTTTGSSTCIGSIPWIGSIQLHVSTAKHTVTSMSKSQRAREVCRLQSVYGVCKSGCAGTVENSAEGSRDMWNTYPSLQWYAEMKRKLAFWLWYEGQWDKFKDANLFFPVKLSMSEAEEQATNYLQIMMMCFK